MPSLFVVYSSHFGKSFFFFFFLNCAFSFCRLFVSFLPILASHFFSSLFSFKLCLLFLSFIRLILPRCCWSFVVLCITSALSFFFWVVPCPLVCYISVGNSLVCTCLFLREVIVWSVFPVCAHCPAEDLPKTMVFIIPDRGPRGPCAGFQARSKRSRDLRREVELDPQLCPEEIMSREVGCWAEQVGRLLLRVVQIGSSTAVQRTLS